MNYLVAILVALPLVIVMTIAGYSMAAPQFGWSTKGWKHWYVIVIIWTGIAMLFVTEAVFSGRLKAHCQQADVQCGFKNGNKFWHGEAGEIPKAGTNTATEKTAQGVAVPTANPQ